MQASPLSFLFLLFLVPFIALGQNLVPNPYFNDQSYCPEFHGQIHYAAPWFSANGTTVDFAHVCGIPGRTGIPNNLWGEQQPVVGQGYAGIRTYYFGPGPSGFGNYREYLSVALLQQLEPATAYFVSFQASPGEAAAFQSYDLGLALEDSVPVLEVLPFKPVIANPVSQYLGDYGAWKKIQGTYIARGTEKFLVIGNFKVDSLTSKRAGGTRDTLTNSTYFYIDEVQVLPCKVQLSDSFLLAPKTFFCPDEVLTLSVAPGLSLNEYTWSTGDNTPAVVVKEGGWYSLEVKDSTGCRLRDSVFVEARPAPPQLLQTTATLCPGGRVLLEAPQDSLTQYRWSTGDTTASIWVEQAGAYGLQTFRQECQSASSIQVETPPLLPVLLHLDTLICEGQTIEWGYSFPQARYEWDNGDIGPFRLMEGPGVYRLSLTTACSQEEATFTLQTQNCDCTLAFPNLFSPNADGINDHWRFPFSEGVQDIRWGIVDRWGRPLFTAAGPAMQWDGRFQGQDAPPGVYFWWLHYRCWDRGNFEVQQTRGSLLLIR